MKMEPGSYDSREKSTQHSAIDSFYGGAPSDEAHSNCHRGNGGTQESGLGEEASVSAPQRHCWETVQGKTAGYPRLGRTVDGRKPLAAQHGEFTQTSESRRSAGTRLTIAQTRAVLWWVLYEDKTELRRSFG